MSDIRNRLPEYDPHPDLWNRIETELDADEKLAQAITELPDFEPADDLWNRIEGALETADSGDEATDEPGRVVPLHGLESARQRPGSSFTRRWRWGVGVAAACALLVGTWLAVRPDTIAEEHIEYAVEQRADVPNMSTEPATDNEADERAEAFINRQCEEAALVCQRPEVRELRAQLAELSQEKQRLVQEQQTFGDDQALVMAQVRVDNQRAEVTKELITLLRS